MLEVKGTTVQSVAKFVTARYGEPGRATWLEALPEGARAIHANPVMPSVWYPAETALIQPTEGVCRTFFSGDPRGAWECGRFSAEEGLKGVYKIFLAVGTPGFIIKKAGAILPQLLRPAEIRVADQGPKSVTLHITRLPGAHALLDARIAGWMERALEISGCSGIRVTIPHSLARGAEVTEFHAEWA